ncbi:MAG: ankyrin repeat domain-containing protein [Verrucomicrobia bacterium]|nr:ankyrin repeat domain-containing protein [Verrucomicrobiota bacterium]
MMLFAIAGIVGLLLLRSAFVTIQKRIHGDGEASSSEAAQPIPPPNSQNTISLEKALVEKLFDMQVRTANGSIVYFDLVPRTSTRAWVRVEPGWRMCNPQDGLGLVTVSSQSGICYTPGKLDLWIHAARLKRSGPLSPVDASKVTWQFERLPANDPLRTFLEKTAVKNQIISWNALQAAVWMLHDNAGLDAIRKAQFTESPNPDRYLSHVAVGSRPSVTCAELDEALAMLQEAGHAPSEFAAKGELEGAFSRAVETWRSPPPNESSALESLAFFSCCRPEVMEMLASICAQRTNPYRGIALKHLSHLLEQRTRPEILSYDRVFEILRRALELEENAPYQSEVECALERGRMIRSEILISAATVGDLSLLGFLLGKGMDVNARTGRSSSANASGTTALIAAVKAGQEEAVDLLLKKGADVEVESPEREKPLLLATARGHASIARKLIARNADINAPGPGNRSFPLAEAAKSGNIELVNSLLERNQASLNSVDEDGHDALYHALSAGHVAVVELLLKKGASPNNRVADRMGALGTPEIMTALDVAREMNHLAMIKALKDAGAKTGKEVAEEKRRWERRIH